ncbi:MULTISPECIES: hypothetical protein [Novosphingobium]|uniref:Uncharacterized protein n=1 Tax=Novosphingobium decolorationis TaxID=2698673 RepID=A0ABX8EBN9_9SPHN|nr:MULTISPECIES: hypothetical protein [Novosphingobium]MBT0671783.1 hypothetical protein [Novosphingobium profundi]QVM86384.1 hypothetical protein HT578_21420 [Novosphingobium decolorationis]
MEKIFADTELADLAADVRRHSFASRANDLRFIEITISPDGLTAFSSRW